MTNERVDAVVVGAGHNGLVAATLLAKAGRSVLVIEAAREPGGATAGTQPFPGVPVRLSRYSYLVSLWPTELSRLLGVDLRLRSRAVASYTPVGPSGLLVERPTGPASEASFRAVTGSDADWAAWTRWGERLDGFAAAVGPVLLGPLLRRSQVRDGVTAAVGSQVWDDLVERPLASALERDFGHDAVRGTLATDALIGTAADLHDPADTRGNRCLLYHVVGDGTGQWRLPTGGMGAVRDTLLDAALTAGAVVRCGVAVTAIGDDEHGCAIDLADGTTIEAGHVLAAVAPAVLDELRGRPSTRPRGSQLKVNMLLRRLPALRSGIDPAVAFAGTMHLGQGWERLEQARRLAEAGTLPDPLPCEVYCHTLTDPTPVAALPGHHTLTLFGLHCPPDVDRASAQQAALSAFRPYLAEPLEDCLARDADGRACVETLTPRDLEREIGLPGGNIFHGDLDWPWLADDEPDDSAARRRGVAVPDSSRVLLAGAGSRRGGGVSGLGGLHAAAVVLGH